VRKALIRIRERKEEEARIAKENKKKGIKAPQV